MENGGTATLERSVIARYGAAIAALADLPHDVAELHGLGEATVLELNALHAKAGRLLGAAGAVIAGEIAHRSRPALGSSGLVQRTGHRTVENFLKFTTGATKEQAITAVKAGTLLAEIADEGRTDEVTGEICAPSRPWLRPVAAAVGDGVISTSAAASIGAGLGSPNSAVTAGQLEGAAARLVAQAVAGVDADRLWREARTARDELDLAGVKAREEERRALRSLTHHPLPAGGGVATWAMDPETYATFVEVYGRMTSPKLGGVRFVDPARAALAQSIKDDDRTPAQLASDGLLHLLMAGADTDDSVMLGSGAPVIRITVTEQALNTGVGLARIDGQADPVSVQTAQRLICEGVSIRMGFDQTGDATSLGTEDRLFTRRQREVLATKFGGCMDGDCDRPPSFCEAHHIQHWARDQGKTVVENGILLCKHHHLKYHRDGTEISRDNHGNYWKIPPPTIDPQQTPIPMPYKTHNLNDLWHRAAS